jgi:hypothetical protein
LSLPAETRRLFSDYDEADLTPGAASSLLISRLLEDGDATDLAWLLQTIPEPALADWFARHGGRQLSIRSRAFWEIVLGRTAGPAHPATEALWPL